MTPYEFAGAVNRASKVFVLVSYGDGEDDWLWLEVSKNNARHITASAKDESRDAPGDIDAEFEGKDLCVGGGVLGDEPEEEEEEEEERQ